MEQNVKAGKKRLKKWKITGRIDLDVIKIGLNTEKCPGEVRMSSSQKLCEIQQRAKSNYNDMHNVLDPRDVVDRQYLSRRVLNTIPALQRDEW